MSQQPSQAELDAVVRLSVYAQSFKDDMECIKNVKSVYRGEVKVLSKRLLNLMSRTFTRHLELLHDAPENGDVIANAWHSMDKIMSTLSKMSMDEMIQFSNETVEYHESYKKRVEELEGA